jgi:UDP-N-acetylmuramoyl-tripeptide--D-alanyl-D-alanine ligase
MRTELLQIGTLTVLSDCYNANPASMKNALQILTGLDPAQKRRLVFICGDMAELGEQTHTLHADLGTSIAKANVELLITVGKSAKITAKAAKKISENSADSPEPVLLQIKCYEDAVSVCNNLREFIKDYDIILVKGSRTARLETVVDKIKELFS